MLQDLLDLLLHKGLDYLVVYGLYHAVKSIPYKSMNYSPRRHSECWECNSKYLQTAQTAQTAALFSRNLCCAQQSHGWDPLANFLFSINNWSAGCLHLRFQNGITVWHLGTRFQTVSVRNLTWGKYCFYFRAGFHPEIGTAPVVQSCYSTCNKISKLVRYLTHLQLLQLPS